MKPAYTKNRTHDFQGPPFLGGEDAPSVGHVGGMLAQRISGTRHRTPEGFLLCESVPIARTGQMIYSRGQIHSKLVNDRGLCYVTRDAKTLFHPRTLASCEGKSLTNDHPPLGVNSSNYKHVTVGHMRNVRRGSGDKSEHMIADVLVTDADAIRAVENGKVELSLGYEADYVPTGSGEARQINIVGNHLALVPRGRCGPSCSIQDSHHLSTEGNGTMPQARKTVGTAERKQFLDAITAGLDRLGGGEDDETPVDENGTHVHVHMRGAAQDAALSGEDIVAASPAFKQLAAQMATLTAALTGDGGAGDDDDETTATKRTADAAAFKSAVADAEILVPGYRAPALDVKKASGEKIAKTIDSIHSKVLDSFAETEDGGELLETLTGDTFDAADFSPEQIETLFKSAAGAQKLLNNKSSTSRTMGAPAAAAGTRTRAAVADTAHRTAGASAAGGEQTRRPGPMSAAEMQAANRKMYPAPGTF